VLMMDDFIDSSGGSAWSRASCWSEMISLCSCIWKQMASARRAVQTVAAWFGVYGGSRCAIDAFAFHSEKNLAKSLSTYYFVLIGW
jgi:hypothetical protein